MAGGQRLALIGLRPNILRQITGLEIVVLGTREDGGPIRGPAIRADEFVVRRANDQPAHDGILRRTPGGDLLEMPDGRRLPIPHLPGELTGADGKRVWIAGPLDAPTRAGIIDPDRQFDRRRPSVVKLGPPWYEDHPLHRLRDELRDLRIGRRRRHRTRISNRLHGNGGGIRPPTPTDR
jgi:hypothetical protein